LLFRAALAHLLCVGVGNFEDDLVVQPGDRAAINFMLEKQTVDRLEGEHAGVRAGTLNGKIAGARVAVPSALRQAGQRVETADPALCVLADDDLSVGLTLPVVVIAPWPERGIGAIDGVDPPLGLIQRCQDNIVLVPPDAVLLKTLMLGPKG
jgi:hypothetical protein